MSFKKCVSNCSLSFHSACRMFCTRYSLEPFSIPFESVRRIRPKWNPNSHLNAVARFGCCRASRRSLSSEYNTQTRHRNDTDTLIAPTHSTVPAQSSSLPLRLVVVLWWSITRRSCACARPIRPIRTARQRRQRRDGSGTTSSHINDDDVRKSPVRAACYHLSRSGGVYLPA